MAHFDLHHYHLQCCFYSMCVIHESSDGNTRNFELKQKKYLIRPVLKIYECLF